MAIQWGRYSGLARVGVEFVRTSQASTSEVWRMDVYLGLTGWASDNYNALTVTGSFSYSGSITVNSGAVSALKLYSASKTFTRRIGQTSPGRVSVSLTEFAAGSPTVTGTFTVSGQPYQAPALPGGVGVRINSNGSAFISFRQNATTTRPVAGFDIRQQTWPGGSTVLVGQPGAASTSLTTGVLPAGGEYRFLVRQRGAGGNGDWAYTAWVQTTPRAPANVVAERGTGQIEISWVGLSTYQASTFEVYQGSTLVASGITGTAYTVESPGAGSLVYTVKERNSSGVVGPGTDSNPISVLAAPYAPTNLTPDGGYVPDGKAITFAWTHNPADGTAQTQHRVRARKAGGSWSYYPTVDTAKQSRTGSFESFAGPGDVIEWEVQTRGEHATFGPYSDTASVTVAARPTVAINSPTANAVVNSSMVAVSASGPVEGFAWTATLTGGGPTQTRTGYCPDGIAAFSTTFSNLRDGGAYTVSVTTETEVKSIPATVSFTVSYPQPGEPTITGDWDAQTGGALVNVANGATPTGGVSASTIRLESLTSRPGDAEEWQILDTLPASADGHTYVDHSVRLHYDAIYRATAISSLGVESTPAVLNMGRNAYPANFVHHDGNTIRLRYNPGLEYTPERADITLVDLDDGNPVPVAILGPAQRNRVSLSGTLFDEEWATAEQQVRDLEWMAYMGGLVLVRTVDQAPMHGVISGMKISRHLSGTYGVSFNVDRAR